jgi:integrase
VYDPTQSANAIQQIQQFNQQLYKAGQQIQKAEQIYTTAVQTRNTVVSAYKRVLTKMCSLGMDEGLVRYKPKVPRLEENPPCEGFVEIPVYDRIHACARMHGLWCEALVECAYTLGWRKSDMLPHTVGQLRFREPEVAVIRLRPGSTKERTGRDVWIDGRLVTLLRRLCEVKSPEDYVFTRENGTRVRSFRGAWAEVCVQAGVGKRLCRECGGELVQDWCAGCRERRVRKQARYAGLTLHDFRPTMVHNQVDTGVNEEDIMQTTGHKTRSVFERYHIVSLESSERAMRKFREYGAEGGAGK